MVAHAWWGEGGKAGQQPWRGQSAITPQAALPASTCLAADLIVAVTSCVKAGRVTPFLPSHPDWILLQSPDEVLHEPKLDQLPEVMVGEES